jgi:hypothetical protein
MQPSWKDLVAMESGRKLVDRFDEGLRFIIMRGPCSLCAYIGVPADHPLADFSYEWLPVRANGGLTYAAKGDGKNFPAGWFFYGWDYAHCGDYCFHDEKYKDGPSKDKKWLVEDVESDSWSTLNDFHNLAKLAEGIVAKSLKLV